MSVASQNEGQVAQCAGLALHRTHVTASLRWPTNAIEKVNCALPFCKHVRGSFDRRVTTAGRHMHVTCCAQGNAHGLLAQAPPICHWTFPQSAARSFGLLARRESQAFKTYSKHRLVPVSTSVTTLQCRGTSLLRYLHSERATQSCRLS